MYDLTPLAAQLARVPDLQAVATASGLSKKTLEKLLTNSCNTTFKTANRVILALDALAKAQPATKEGV